MSSPEDEERRAFEQLMVGAGIYDAKVMTWLVDEDGLQELCAVDCRRCGADLQPGTLVQAWGEPFKVDSTVVAITCFCSEHCVAEHVMQWVEDHYPDATPDVLMTFHAMNYTEEST